MRFESQGDSELLNTFLNPSNILLICYLGMPLMYKCSFGPHGHKRPNSLSASFTN